MKILLVFTIGISLSAYSKIPFEEDVLKATKEHYPLIKEAYLQLQASQHNVLAAKGNWDTKITSNSYMVPRGFYTRRLWDAQVEKPLRFANSKIYAGYSNGFSGIWPDQFSTETTNSGGSPRIGGSFSALRGLTIDEKRAGLKNAHFALKQREAETFYNERMAFRDARLSYWNWISALRNYKVYHNLFTVAELRKENLNLRVKAGDISSIVAKENLQYLARRNTELASAELQVKQAALDLSLFYRDSEGNPVVLDHNSDEGLDEIVESKISEINVDSVISTIVGPDRILSRPDLFSFSQELMINQTNIELAENSYFPKLDIGFDYTRNLGDQDPTNAPHVWTVLFNVEIPLEYNLIKGQVRSAHAQKRILNTTYNFLLENAKVEVEKSKEAIRLSKIKMQNTKEEADYAKELLDSENYKFTKGGSNFFLINIREEALAEAREKYILSQFEVIAAYANYEIATIEHK